jgi:hypothetical protein
VPNTAVPLARESSETKAAPLIAVAILPSGQAPIGFLVEAEAATEVAPAGASVGHRNIVEAIRPHHRRGCPCT